MKLFKYLALCIFISTTHASNPLGIEEGNEFKSLAAPNVYLYCTEISALPETVEGKNIHSWCTLCLPQKKIAL